MIKPIRNILISLIPKEHHWKLTLLKEWDNLIGPLKANVFLQHIDGNQLHVGVTHPAWAQEIRLLSPILIEKINAFLGKNYIKDIRFKVITRPTVSKTEQADPNNLLNSLKKQQRTEYTLSNKEKEITQKIKDSDLRDVIESFLVRCKNQSAYGGTKNEKETCTEQTKRETYM
ncbi:MAG: DUF721 domain-containing protein [bacterium]